MHHIPPTQPPDAAQAVATCRQYLARAVRLLETAQTPTEQREAELWIDNAERNLTKWQRALERIPLRGGDRPG